MKKQRKIDVHQHFQQSFQRGCEEKTGSGRITKSIHTLHLTSEKVFCFVKSDNAVLYSGMAGRERKGFW